MKHLKRTASFLLALTLTLPLFGCDAPKGTLTLTDQAGRTVTIEKDPEAIVSGYYISTSMLLALGEKNHLVGIESKAETRALYPAVGLDLSIGGYGTKKAFETEKAALLQPDLIILPYSLKQSADEISAVTGAPVLVVNPESDPLMQEALSLLAEATGTQEKAKELTNYVDEAISKVQTLESTPSVYLAGSDLLRTAGSKMYQSTLIQNARTVNVASSISDSSWANISYETLLSYQPDYLILSSACPLSVEEVLSDKNLAALSAVREGKVYQMPTLYEAWDSPVPGAFLGSLWLASVCHAEYPVSAFEQTAEEFYRLFYGI